MDIQYRIDIQCPAHNKNCDIKFFNSCDRELFKKDRKFIKCIKSIWMDGMITRDSIKEKFLNEVAEHGQAVEVGDHKEANKIHKKLYALYILAKEQNQADIFSELLIETDENVRLWAATFTLKIYPDLAEKTLSNLAELSNITGLSAKTTIHLWKDGVLNLL
jgi:hypothetical protein